MQNVKWIRKMRNKTKFNVECAHCGKRNITAWTFQFDVPKYYTAYMLCNKCGKETKVEFKFSITAVRKLKEKK